MSRKKIHSASVQGGRGLREEEVGDRKEAKLGPVLVRPAASGPGSGRVSWQPGAQPEPDRSVVPHVRPLLQLKAGVCAALSPAPASGRLSGRTQIFTKDKRRGFSSIDVEIPTEMQSRLSCRYTAIREELPVPPSTKIEDRAGEASNCNTGSYRLWYIGHWSTNLFLFASFSYLQAKLCTGQRQVTVQKGPLYRAEGYPISIGCEVTGYQGPSEQQFQWSVYLPSAPTQEVQIVSTSDASFTYAKYGQRVRNKEIYVERLRGDSVLLHISRLLMKDSGEYECYTPNTDDRYYGNYSAKTRLIGDSLTVRDHSKSIFALLPVIPDTLSATMTPQTLSKEEGEPLELTCEASKATAQHTHLSVTWLLMQDGGQSKPIQVISLSRDFVLEPGPLYTKRFADGDVGFDKLGVATFRLSIERLQPSDQGQLFCEATEWIQDPDESWTFITKKQTNQVTLSIQPAVWNGVTLPEPLEFPSKQTEASALSSVSATGGEDAPVSEHLPCFCFLVRDFQVHIEAESTFTEGKSLQLLCLVVGGGWNPQLRGVWFFNNAEVACMDAGGVLSWSEDYNKRASQGLLQVSKLSPKNFSLSILSVGPEDEGAYRCAVSEMERGQTGTWQVLQQKQSLDHRVHLRKPAARRVLVNATQQAVWEGELLALLCRVEGPESNLSVSWLHTPQGRTQPDLVARMGPDGTVALGPNNRGNGRLEKRDWATFQLDVSPAAVTDGGLYECRVSEKTRNQAPGPHWSGEAPVTVNSLRKCLPLSGLIPAFAVGHSGVSLHVLLSTPTTGPVISGFQVCQLIYIRVLSFDLANIAKLCFAFPPAESSLQVNLVSRQPQVQLTGTFDLSCLVKASYSDLNMPLTVTWQFQPAASQDSHQFIRITHDGAIEWDDALPQFQNKTKVSQSSFRSQLLIHDATEKEAGVYQCKVDVYDRSSPRTKGPVRASATSHPLRIAVTLPESKLRVNSSSPAQEVFINSDAVVDCGILFRSTGNLHLAITWYFSPTSTNATSIKLLEVDQTNVVKYGDEFHDPRRKQKFHTVKVSPNLFRLHILSVEHSDQGRYRCSVREWLLSADGTWHGLGEKTSGPTELKLRPTGSVVRVSKEHRTENVTEHREVALRCSLESPSSSASLFSVKWFWSPGHSENKTLAHLQHDGLLQYWGEEALRHRLHCYRSSATDFVLTLRPVELADAGSYWCQVTEWRLHENPSKWVSQASDESPHMVLTVLPSEPTLPSRICSSEPLLYFLLVLPLLMLIPLLVSVLCLYRKNRKLSMLSFSAKKEKALWVDMRRTAEKTLSRTEEDEDDEAH
ncbi:Immunoglobulin superfamily member 2 [Galemys pyrenaicus]|nr:Immunoglobulin superfamily member 2 [Galemys pyrenaicus]